MLLPRYTLSVPTPFGEAHFGIELTEAGRVHHLQLPLEGLPDTVAKLTYGKEWRDARQYFERLAVTLPYRLEAVLFAPRHPQVFDGVVQQFREQVDRPLPVTDYAKYWQQHVDWIGVFGFKQQRVDGVLNRLLRLAPEELRELAHYLMPYLLTLLPLEFTRTSDLIYRLIGAFGTVEAREFLLGQLEREGRHPYTAAILAGLEHYRDTPTAERLQATYGNDSFGEEELETYIRGLARFPVAAVSQHLEQLLRERAAAVAPITATLRQLGYADARLIRLLTDQFTREQDYYNVHALVRELLTFPGPPAVSLAALNEKLAAPAFTDLPPVNWPQQLELGWRRLIDLTPPADVLQVVEQYLDRPEPRLQRNAILQLKALQAAAQQPLALSAGLERRLRELLGSRYDKVYVELMNVLGYKRPLLLRSPGQMLDALLSVSVGNQYRFVVLNALRRVGHTAELKAHARDYYTGLVPNLRAAGRLGELRALLPYLEKYLGPLPALQLAAGQRATR